MNNINNHCHDTSLFLNEKLLDRFIIAFKIQECVHKDKHAILAENHQHLPCSVHFDLWNRPTWFNDLLLILHPQWHALDIYLEFSNFILKLIFSFLGLRLNWRQTCYPDHFFTDFAKVNVKYLLINANLMLVLDGEFIFKFKLPDVKFVRHHFVSVDVQLWLKQVGNMVAVVPFYVYYGFCEGLHKVRLNFNVFLVI
jgi:hypothetical protein